jgi:hypothetical protein
MKRPAHAALRRGARGPAASSAIRCAEIGAASSATWSALVGAASSAARRAALGVALLGLSIAACSAGGPAPAPSATSDARPAPLPSARRPTRRYYLARSQDRCEVYSVDGEASPPRTSTPCPPDLEIGERIRLSGKTCMRESPEGVTREQPVVCPDPLTLLELKDRSARR